MHFRKPYKSKAFLAWVKTQPASCCVCRDNSGFQTHHFGKKGMGQKATDLLVCRACQECHSKIQGKHHVAFERLDDTDTYINILKDGLDLLCGYVQKLEARLENLKVEDDEEPF